MVWKIECDKPQPNPTKTCQDMSVFNPEGQFLTSRHFYLCTILIDTPMCSDPGARSFFSLKFSIWDSNFSLIFLQSLPNMTSHFQPVGNCNILIGELLVFKKISSWLAFFTSWVPAKNPLHVTWWYFYWFAPIADDSNLIILDSNLFFESLFCKGIGFKILISLFQSFGNRDSNFYALCFDKAFGCKHNLWKVLIRIVVRQFWWFPRKWTVFFRIRYFGNL